jgi:hypothetical protein
MNAAVATQLAATQKVAEAEHALEAATHDVELYRRLISDRARMSLSTPPLRSASVSDGSLRANRAAH